MLKNHYFISNVFKRLLEKIILEADRGRWGQQPFDFNGSLLTYHLPLQVLSCNIDIMLLNRL